MSHDLFAYLVAGVHASAARAWLADWVAAIILCRLSTAVGNVETLVDGQLVGERHDTCKAMLDNVNETGKKDMARNANTEGEAHTQDCKLSATLVWQLHTSDRTKIRITTAPTGGLGWNLE